MWRKLQLKPQAQVPVPARSFKNVSCTSPRLKDRDQLILPQLEREQRPFFAQSENCAAQPSDSTANGDPQPHPPQQAQNMNAQQHPVQPLLNPQDFKQTILEIQQIQQAVLQTPGLNLQQQLIQSIELQDQIVMLTPKQQTKNQQQLVKADQLHWQQAKMELPLSVSQLLPPAQCPTVLNDTSPPTCLSCQALSQKTQWYKSKLHFAGSRLISLNKQLNLLKEQLKASSEFLSEVVRCQKKQVFVSLAELWRRVQTFCLVSKEKTQGLDFLKQKQRYSGSFPQLSSKPLDIKLPIRKASPLIAKQTSVLPQSYTRRPISPAKPASQEWQFCISDRVRSILSKYR